MLHRVVVIVTLVTLLVFPMGKIRAAEPFATVEPLTGGLHLGYGSFAPVSDDDLPALDARIAEASAAGMNVARVMVDWAEIEPTAGQFDRSALDAQLARIPAGTRLFLTLGVTDVDHYSVPEDLVDEAGILSAPLDEPGVTGRYLALLDQILPDLVNDNGLFALSVANEPDVLLADRPETDTYSLAGFTTSVREYADEWFPGLGVTVTISGGGVTYPAKWLADMIDATSISAVNWGCIDLATFMVSDIASIPDEIQLLTSTFGDRDIILQELSCPSGYGMGRTTIGSSEEFQTAWFGAFFAAMSRDSHIRAAFVFDLIDWPADLAATYSDFLRAEGMGEIAGRYQELLGSWGLLNVDLGPKPAWDVFVEAIEANA